MTAGLLVHTFQACSNASLRNAALILPNSAASSKKALQQYLVQPSELRVQLANDFGKLPRELSEGETRGAYFKASSQGLAS